VPELIVYQDKKKFFHVQLEGDKFSIGRSSTNDLILTGDSISRQHAIIRKENGKFWIEDVSTLGTKLNNRNLDTKIQLKNEHTIEISDWKLLFLETTSTLKKTQDTRKTQIKGLREKKDDPTKILKFTPDQEGFQFLRPLLLIDSKKNGKSHFNVRKKTLVVGNSSQCDIVLEDDYASKMHAEFHLSDRGFLIKDLESTNGTLINGAKIREKYATNKDEITVGRTKITVMFERSAKQDITPFSEDNFCGIIAKSRTMKLLFKKIEIIAKTAMTVLIQGETGTGKELVARAIHDLSQRHASSFVVINCSAISPHLIESELFGHEKGAFTGADKRHLGVFEQASGGTLFLDEIGELPLELQAKLLRAIEYQNFRRVGGSENINVNVRLIAATHRDLSRLIGLERFREDLYYRLSVLPLTIPSLRERKEDIETIANSFIHEFSPKGQKELSKKALDKLLSHSWPGNVRELRNTILRSLTFCQERVISSDDIEIISVIQSAKIDRNHDSGVIKLLRPQKHYDDRELIVKTLKSTGGDKSKAAKMLGIGRSTLFRRIKQFDIPLSED